MTISESLSPEIICKAKERTPAPPHHISYEEKEYVPLRVEAELVMTVPQPGEQILHDT